MSDRSILFSAPMVRALIAGTKTQTRRIIKPSKSAPIEALKPFDPDVSGAANDPCSWGIPFGEDGACHMSLDAWPEMWCRYSTGDRLWVREAWRTGFSWDDMPPREIPAGSSVSYEAGGYRMSGRLRASMHMPRWASRLTLIITDVRVQRLQDISEEDARAEGCRLGGDNESSSNAVFEFQCLGDC